MEKFLRIVAFALRCVLGVVLLYLVVLAILFLSLWFMPIEVAG